MNKVSKPNNKIRNDLILVAALLVIAAAGFILMNSFKQAGDWAVVTVDGVETARFLLSEDTGYVIEVGDGGNILVISDGKAMVSDASCPDLICVHHRPISNVGETIVCLPNKVVISIEKSSSDGLDASA